MEMANARDLNEFLRLYNDSRAKAVYGERTADLEKPSDIEADRALYHAAERLLHFPARRRRCWLPRCVWRIFSAATLLISLKACATVCRPRRSMRSSSIETPVLIRNQDKKRGAITWAW